MASQDPKPRRVREPGEKNANVYRRADGKFEIGYRDSDGRQRWRGPFGTVTAARAARDEARGRSRRGERESANPRLKFGEAADRWLAEQVAELRPATRAIYKNSIENHLRPRWGGRRLDSLTVDDGARLVRELRAQGLSEWTISGVLKAASRVFKFARRRCSWHGENPLALLEAGERPRISQTAERRIYTQQELEQTIAAADEPWRTLFRLASVVGGRESELLGLWWEDLELGDLDAATLRFTHQVDRGGVRVPLKTEEAKATLPIPRATAAMLLEHEARAGHSGRKAFVFGTRTGKPLGQRNVLRALYRAQEKARDADGRPTFPELFTHDERGHLAVDKKGRYVLRKAKRSDLPPLPDFHALRHGAAMDCDDAEEARDLLRHKNSNVTRAIYRAHFDDKRRQALRARMEARMEAANGNGAQQTPDTGPAEVLDLQAARGGGR